MRQAPLTAADGTELFAYVHTPPAGKDTRAAALYLHGYGEHAGRHAHVCRRLAEQGIATLALDYRGHGKAGGQRGHCERFDELLGDALTGWQAMLRELPGTFPRFFVAHSHGALMALRLLSEPERLPTGVAGAVLSSPFLGFPPVPKWKTVAGRIASRLVPKLSMPSGLDAKDFTHDQGIIDAWKVDPLVHKVATARWFTEAKAAQQYVEANAGRVPVPTIWLWGERDRVVDPTVTARVAPRTPRAELHPQPGLFHEIFNEREPEREQLLGKVDAWLRARC